MKDIDNDPVPEYILRKGLLSWDEIQLIEYTREHPEELKRLLAYFSEDNPYNKK